MLPQFPEFKKLELSDRGDVEAITSRYEPYSDFNFVSMWSYDTEGSMAISELNGNLVVRFADYETGEPFYSFLGDSECQNTVEALLELSVKEGLPAVLKLVPEISLTGIDREKFEATEVRDHFDYLLDLVTMADLEANHVRGHSNFNRRFLEEHGEHLTAEVMNLGDLAQRQRIAMLTSVWMRNKHEQNKSFLAHLDQVVDRYLKVAETGHEKLFAVGLIYKGELVGCTINELVDGEYAITHYMKADNKYKGIYSHLVNRTAAAILPSGRKYINFEQDMGWPNLRQAKKTYPLARFLKKFEIKKR